MIVKQLIDPPAQVRIAAADALEIGFALGGR